LYVLTKDISVPPLRIQKTFYGVGKSRRKVRGDACVTPRKR